MPKAKMLTRRGFLQTTAIQTGIQTAALQATLSAAQAQPKRIAILATIYRLQSHAQHMDGLALLQCRLPLP